MYGIFTYIYLYIYHKKSTIHVGKYIIPWFYDTGKGGQSNSDIPRSQQLRSSPSGLGLCQLCGYLRSSSRRVPDGRGQGECGAGDTPVTWRRGGCKGEGELEIYDFWGLYFLSSVQNSCYFLGEESRWCTHVPWGRLSLGICSSFSLHGKLASSPEFHVVSLGGFSRSSRMTNVMTWGSKSAMSSMFFCGKTIILFYIGISFINHSAGGAMIFMVFDLQG